MSSFMPNAHGYFGAFGGRYVPETLMSALDALSAAFDEQRFSPGFQQRLQRILAEFVGRPTPMQDVERLTNHCGGARILLKREDLAHTGAHKINNALGQALLAECMGKKRIIAETGAGQHGVATATACAMLDLECVVYMGSEDIRRQRPNVQRMKLLGAKVVAVESGACTLKDAINEAIRDWVTNIDSTHYIIGSAVGPHPYPLIVREFQRVIGEESRRQVRDRLGDLPDAIVACVGGGSNAIGMFYPFLDDAVRLIGVEASGEGLDTPRHSATVCGGRVGVLHGARSYLLQDSEGQVTETHSISAGLDYPGVGPEHAFLHESGRVDYVSITDQEALDAFQQLCRLEGIVPALESSHAVAFALKLATELGPEQTILVNLSGRGDKDLGIVEGVLG